MSRQAFIVSALRTAVAPSGGAFNATDLHDLAAPVLRCCLAEAGLEPDQLDELILGNALGGGGNPARLAALNAGLPVRIAGLSIDRQCCSGLDAISLAAQIIRAGAADVILAGGAESHSRRPTRLRTDPDGGPAIAYDRPPFSPWPDRDPDMHVAAAKLAVHERISKQEQDDWAIASHRHARAAKDRLRQEMVPLATAALERDPFTRDLSPGLCARAKPICGTITPANAAVSADAAAFTLIVSERMLGRLKTPTALRIRQAATLGAEPEWPGLAPVTAIRHVLEAEAQKPATLTRVEVMEAYAVQAIACLRHTDLPVEIANMGGGALARGHPIGASGAILAVRLFHELAISGGCGLAAIAAAGGLGSALLLGE